MDFQKYYKMRSQRNIYSQIIIVSRQICKRKYLSFDIDKTATLLLIYVFNIIAHANAAPLLIKKVFDYPLLSNVNIMKMQIFHKKSVTSKVI